VTDASVNTKQHYTVSVQSLLKLPSHIHLIVNTTLDTNLQRRDSWWDVEDTSLWSKWTLLELKRLCKAFLA